VVNVNETIEKFKNFIEDTVLAEFLERLRVGMTSFYIDYKELARHDLTLAGMLLDDPVESIKAIELAAERIVDGKKSLSVVIKNLPKTQLVKIRNIRTDHIDKLVYIEGQIKSKTTVRPLITSARFECPSCGAIIPVLMTESKFKEPSKCGCGRKGKFTLLVKIKTDAQNLSVEEDLGEIGEDSIPQTINCLLKGKHLTSPEINEDILPPRPVRVTGIIK